MKKYKCILFDLDGTLVNTFPGILHSYQHVAKITGLPIPTEKIVGEAIGAPLAEVFEKRFGFQSEGLENALKLYRAYYLEYGLYEVEHYEGMKDTLHNLKKRGFCLGVTTLKKENFAIEILKNLELLEYFDIVVGMDEGDHLTKSQMIEKAIDKLGQKKEYTLLVGDSHYDAIGASEACIQFIAVTYGFGFKNEDEPKEYKCIGTIKRPFELTTFI